MNIKDQRMAIEITIPKKSCVYFLTNEDGEILYIGKSKNNTLGRIGTHQYEKEFSRAFFISCSGDKEMNGVESKLVLKYKPKYNRMINDKKSVGLVGVNDIKKIIDIDRRVIKRAAQEYGIDRVLVGSIDYYENGIIDAIKKYVGSLKRCPLSIPYPLWKSLGKNKGK